MPKYSSRDFHSIIFKDPTKKTKGSASNIVEPTATTYAASNQEITIDPETGRVYVTTYNSDGTINVETSESYQAYNALITSDTSEGTDYEESGSDNYFTGMSVLTYDTWTDWRLIPSSRPVIVPAQRITKYVDIPGMSSALDLTDYFGITPIYGDRTGQLEFYAVGEDMYALSTQKLFELIKEMNKVFAGNTYLMQLKDENISGTNIFYKGRFQVKEEKSEANFSKVVIEYRLDPYRRSYDSSWKETAKFL